MTAMPEFNTVNIFDYALIGLYFMIIIWVGLYAARQNKNTDEYFKGGGKIPWMIAGLSNWVSGYSAFMFVAAAGFTYLNGIGATLIFTSAVWAYLLGYLIFGRLWHRARISSPLQFLTRRYSPSTTYFYSLTAIIPQIVGIGQGLYILCIFVSTALGFNERVFDLGVFSLPGFQLSIILVGGVMVLYSVIGGLWAAVLSDTVQAVIITVMTLIIFPVSFSYLGGGHGILAGFERLMDEAPKGFLQVNGDTANPLFLIAYLINVLLGYNVGWQMVQRYYSVPDERDTRKMAILCAVLSLIGPILWILPVMASRIIFPDINTLWPSFAVPAEASFVSLALMLLPHGLIGFVVSAILSATLGQANDSFNWLAATLTRDVYAPIRRRLSRQYPSDRHQLFVARMTMFVVGALGIWVALYIPTLGGAFEFALQFYSLTAAFMMPVALGLLYTRTPWWSGIASCSAAIIVALTLMGLGLWSDQAFIRNMFSESLAATIVFFGSAFWFRKDDPRNEELLKFEEDLKRPSFSERVGFDPSGLRAYALIGRICLILGVVLLGCVLLPSPLHAPTSLNLVAGAMLLMLGGVIMYYFRNRLQPFKGVQ
jgi:SSS family solute:Na+ symporter